VTRSRVAGTIEASSLEEHQEVLKGVWNLHCKPLAAGSMETRTTFLSTSSLLIHVLGRALDDSHGWLLSNGPSCLSYYGMYQIGDV